MLNQDGSLPTNQERFIMKISRSELIGLISTTRGAKVCTVVYNTDARLRKTGNPHKAVQKRVVMNGMVGYKYAHALEKKTAEAGLNPADAREVHDRTWGTRVGDTPLIEHNGKSYMDVMINNVIESVYKDTETGKILPFNKVKDFLPNKNSSLVKVANICIDNIESIKIGGECYEIQ